jgi:BirA family transcriptional regulator, biotin operon repressor / biotin---[acetyl-CoA-carboxylase] ligase
MDFETLQLQNLLAVHQFQRFHNFRLILLDSVDSTQTFLQDRPDSKKEGVLVISRIQTKGKGREGRAWVSEDGGLWMTLVLEPPKPEVLAELPQIATRSIVATFHEFDLLDCSVKLPNDVYCSGKKIAGVLVDAIIEGERSIAYLGVGINLNNDPRKNSLIGEIATSFVAETGQNVDLERFAFFFLVNLDSEYARSISSEK